MHHTAIGTPELEPNVGKGSQIASVACLHDDLGQNLRWSLHDEVSLVLQFVSVGLVRIRAVQHGYLAGYGCLGQHIVVVAQGVQP